MRAKTSRRLLLGLVGILVLSLLALLPVLRTGAHEPTSTRSSSVPLSPREAALSEPEGELPAAPAAAEGSVLDPRVEAQPGAWRLLVLRRTDRTPVPGVSVHARGAWLAGPSDDDGTLEFEREKAQPLVIWGEGWLPVFVRTYEATPETVLMDEASARLEVRLSGMDPEDKVVRSLLQPRAFPVVAEDPWSPVLKNAGRDRLAGERLPAGDYDVYVWVARGSDSARCLASPAVRLESAKLEVLELDAGAPPEPEPDS